ncbi:MAG: response regulator [Polyangiaceae bacterium]
MPTSPGPVNRVDISDPASLILNGMSKLRARLGEITGIVESLCALRPSSGEEALIEAAIFAQRHAEVLRELNDTIAACEQGASSLREQQRALRASESPPRPSLLAAPMSTERPSVPAVLEEPANDDSDGEGPVTQVDPRFRRVLVVDDDPAVLRAFRRVLQKNYDVVTARSGSEALRIVLSDSHIDGILCDLEMPELDGQAFFAELGELCPQLLPRVVFVTGGIATEKSQHFVEGLETPVLHKPVAADALLEALEAVHG